MIRASSLLGLEVLTEDGARLGRVQDIRLRRDSDPGRDGSWEVEGLVIGSGGVLERLGVTGAGRAEPITSGDLVPWDGVRRLKGNRLVVDRDSRAT